MQTCLRGTDDAHVDDLIHQLQDALQVKRQRDLREARLSALGPALLLSGPAADIKDEATWAELECLRLTSFAAGYEFAAHRTRRADAATPANAWWGTETRTDSLGRQWTRSFRNAVIDDFGYLVEVRR